MDFRKVAYWIATALVALAMIAGGALDFLLVDDVKATMDHLGYPYYFARIIGVWKVLGGIAILAPGLERVKEWAYAGIFFDLTGAFASHLSVGDGPESFMPPLVVLLFLIVSYVWLDERE